MTGGCIPLPSRLLLGEVSSTGLCGKAHGASYSCSGVILGKFSGLCCAGGWTS